MKMNKLDTIAELKCIEEHQERERVRKNGVGWLEFFKGSFEWAKGVEIESGLTTRQHIFSCGTEGEVADEVVIKIKFPKGTDVQPHSDFDNDFAVSCLRTVLDNMNGIIENN